MYRLFVVLCIFFSHYSLQAQYAVTGGNGVPYKYRDNLAGTNLQTVFLLNGLNAATISYTAEVSSVIFYYYETSVADKISVPSTDITTMTSGGKTIYQIANITDGKGYVAEVNGVLQEAVWIIDYSAHQPVLTSITIEEDEDKCDYIKLHISKSDELFFYAQNGVKRSVERKYTIEYPDVEWNPGKKTFEKTIQSVPEQIYSTEAIISAPYCDTEFTLSGDQFAKHFGIENRISTSMYEAAAVLAQIDASQEDSPEPNGNEETALGGSAPLNIAFNGYGNEPVAYYYTWFIYKKENLENAIARYTDKDIRYTFTESGDYVVRLEVADRSSACAQTAEVTLNVSESMLDVPNFFAPDGENMFKVSYKSLISFKCTIFNRWGNRVYQWTDPAQGWNGKYNGHIVNPGVYFYVIEAKGSDGINYKKSGDINVLHKK